jgi:hypothetical protein
LCRFLRLVVIKVSLPFGHKDLHNIWIRFSTAGHVRIALRRKSLHGSAKVAYRKAPGKIENSPSATTILHATRKKPVQNSVEREAKCRMLKLTPET